MPPRQRFQEKWLSDARFQSWLARVPDNESKAYCQVCHSTVSAEISSLKRHMGPKHMALEEKLRERTAGRSTGADTASTSDQNAGLLDGVAYATTMFIMFLAEHNLPFR